MTVDPSKSFCNSGSPENNMSADVVMPSPSPLVKSTTGMSFENVWHSHELTANIFEGPFNSALNRTVQWVINDGSCKSRVRVHFNGAQTLGLSRRGI